VAISNTLQFYLDRARQARSEAEEATLSHVRERCRRSEAAWSSLAQKAARAQEGRLQQTRTSAGSSANDDNDA
jgi:hypothetical protein